MTDVADRGRSGLDGLDRPVRRLFERIAGPAAAATPDLAAIGAALVELAGDVDYLAPWIARFGPAGGGLPIHAPERGPRLSIVHRPEGQMGAVHDHGTWVAVSPIVGLETHRRYRLTGGGPAARPELVEALSLEPTQLATLLPPDDLHDHGHLAGHGLPAYVLIMTGDDQTRFTRNEWDLATGRHRLLKPGDGGRWLASEPMPPDERGD
jgi:predicted metal-dependent enzyme (double-stranded beta helix superfamily)